MGTAAIQWLTVRKGGKGALKWLVLWGVGLLLGMLVYVGSYSLSESVKTLYSTSWATEIGVIGFLAGSLAAATSGHALYQSLSRETD
jgi:hypothetical protein